MTQPTRRKVLAGAAALAAGTVAMAGGVRLKRWLDQPEAPVMVLKATYDSDLVDLFVRGLRECPKALRQAKGGTVVLKPNLVEAAPGRPINTDPRVVAALVEAFRHHGARTVVVAEGPGHHRDTELILEITGLSDLLRQVKADFIDLNIDNTHPVKLARNMTGMGTLQLPRTVLDCDLFVSVAKMKTHHWVGATLTMKNLFGTVPGAVYGWPKNPLHHAGLDQSILDLWLATRPGLGVVDGIVGMQGDGPIMGQPKDAGVIVMGEQLPAVDATAARVMGLRADKLRYLAAAARMGGTLAEDRILQRGERITPTPFNTPPDFDWLAAG
jgi:uncharacterized protein (DUF362 family)